MSDLKDYVDLKSDELKLRTTEGLSVAMGRLTATLLLVGLNICLSFIRFLIARFCTSFRWSYGAL